MDPFIPLTDPGPAAQKRKRIEQLHSARSVLQLTADCIRGKNGLGTSASKSGRLCTAQEGLTIFPKSFCLSSKYLKGYQWLKHI